MIAYQDALGVALLVIGAGLVCVALIWRRHEPPESDDDTGELRTFVDSLRRTDEATEEYARPRIDRIRNEDPSKADGGL
jgi:hypothetical protein